MSIFPTKILLATDGSEDATLAASAAVDVSKGTDSELHLVHVLPRFPEGVYPGITQELYSYVLDETFGEARHLLDGQAKLIDESGGTITETHIRRGRPADEILALAQEIGAGLIVMGSRGLGPVKRLLLGSVAEGVVHHASCPVLVTRGGRGAWPPERAAIGDDGSEDAQSAGMLAACIGARVRLVLREPRRSAPSQIEGHFHHPLIGHAVVAEPQFSNDS